MPHAESLQTPIGRGGGRLLYPLAGWEGKVTVPSSWVGGVYLFPGVASCNLEQLDHFYYGGVYMLHDIRARDTYFCPGLRAGCRRPRETRGKLGAFVDIDNSLLSFFCGEAWPGVKNIISVRPFSILFNYIYIAWCVERLLEGRRYLHSKKVS